jgi:hypothetical protein
VSLKRNGARAVLTWNPGVTPATCLLSSTTGAWIRDLMLAERERNSNSRRSLTLSALAGQFTRSRFPNGGKLLLQGHGYEAHVCFLDHRERSSRLLSDSQRVNSTALYRSPAAWVCAGFSVVASDGRVPQVTAPRRMGTTLVAFPALMCSRCRAQILSA